MKKILFVFATAMFAFCACNQNKTAEQKNVSAGKGSAESADNVISFKVNGTQVNSAGWNVSRVVMGSNAVVNITSDMHKEPRTVNININTDKAGSFKLGPDNLGVANTGYGSYKPDYMGDMYNSYYFQSGELDISSMDTVKNLINATFSGKVKNEKGELLDITEGKVINCNIAAGLYK